MNACAREVRRARPLLGTYAQVVLRGTLPREAFDAAAGAAFGALAEVDRLMSARRPDSDLARLNRARPGAWTRVAAPTLRVLRASEALRRASRGAFDPRCATPRAVLRRSSAARRPAVEFGRGRARKTGPWTLSLDGVAKGFAVDLAVERARLAAPGLSGLVNAGGDLRAWGPEGFPVFIRARDALSGPLTLARAALAASRPRGGDGPRLAPAALVRMADGARLRGGRTAAVIARTCLEADALTKVVLSASPRAAAACLRARRASAVVLDARGRLARALG